MLPSSSAVFLFILCSFLLKMKWVISAALCKSSVAIERWNSFWKLEKNWAKQALVFSKLYFYLRIINPGFRFLFKASWKYRGGQDIRGRHFPLLILVHGCSESTISFCCHHLFIKPKQYRNNTEDFSQELSGKVPIPVYCFFS